MFSSGNLAERVRMARCVRAGETVVDLFGGIGYFSIPIAVHARPGRVVACEVNPTAFAYLLENIRLNRAGAVEARLGNCRETAPKEVADRVILGHFDAERYLDTALEAVKDRATLHVHGLHRSLEARRGTPALSEIPLARRLEAAASRHGFEVLRVDPRFVKWYGPHRLHFVLDAEVARK
jgi:tRNA wybutosine-synthesizing protein 2